MARRKYMLLYHSYLDDIELLDDAERGRLFSACLSYSVYGSFPELSGNERFVFPHIRAQIDRDAQAYIATCDKNAENARKRWQSRGLSDSDMRSDAIYAKENNNANENDNDNEKGNDNDSFFKKSISISEIDPEAKNVWIHVLTALKSEISDVAFNTWFDDCFPQKWENGLLSLYSPSPLKQTTIDSEFMPKIREITEKLLADGVIH